MDDRKLFIAGKALPDIADLLILIRMGAVRKKLRHFKWGMDVKQKQ